MTDESKSLEQGGAEDEDPRKQLWIRAGMAGGLIALLLGGLAVFDHLSRPPRPDESAVPTRPIAPARVLPDVGRDAPPEVVRAASPEAEAPPAAVPPLPADEEAEAPALPAARTAEVNEPRGGKTERSTRAPEPVRAVARPATPVAAPAAAVPAVADAPARPAVLAPAVPRVAAPAPAVSGETRPPAAAPAPRAPVHTAQAPAVGKPPESVHRAAPATEAGGGYGLPMGVYRTPAEAEALRARLSAEGIPSRLETRVVAGPFPDRGEALAAQARLREKGFTAGELIPFRR